MYINAYARAGDPRNEARRIAANDAKLPEPVAQGGFEKSPSSAMRVATVRRHRRRCRAARVEMDRKAL
jgi:hypothetical protein